MIALLADVTRAGAHYVIDGLPVMIPLAFLAFLAAVWRLHRHGAITFPRLTSSAVACVYGAGVLHAVLLPFVVLTGSARDGLAPWRMFVNLTPVTTALGDPIGIVLNVALFVPLGMMLPLMLRAPSAWRVVVTGFLVSLGVELVQLLADVTVSTGRIADVDDLLGNTAGVLIGYVLFRSVIWLPGADRVAAAVRLPTSVGQSLTSRTPSRSASVTCVTGAPSLTSGSWVPRK